MKPFLRVFLVPPLLIFALRLIAQQGESPLPELPADVAKEATLWMLLADKTPAGQDAVWTTASGDVVEFFQFNDRGRGPKTYSTYRFGDRGIVSYEETHGVDYMKNRSTRASASKTAPRRGRTRLRTAMRAASAAVFSSDSTPDLQALFNSHRPC